MNNDEKQCPYCGELIKTKAKKCRYCGEYIKTNVDINSNNKNAIFICIIIFLCVLTMINLFIFISPKNNSDNKYIDTKVEKQETVQTPKVIQNQKKYSDILNKIDRYQAQYWQIIERNDMFLTCCGEEEDFIAKDIRDLKRLKNTVISQINKNNIYLKKYYNTKNNHAECTGDTTYDMSMAALQDYKSIDKLLNEVYQVVRKKLPPEDFEKLKQSEIKWIRHRERYAKIKFEQDEYGSFGRCVGIKIAETDACKFRTLLLLLYF